LFTSEAFRKSILDLLNRDIEKRSIDRSNSSLARKLRKRVYLSRKETYACYCELLQKIAGRLYSKEDSHALTKTEMALFSLADTVIAEGVAGYFLKPFQAS
jgi:hypothetical protein